MVGSIDALDGERHRNALTGCGHVTAKGALLYPRSMLLTLGTVNINPSWGQKTGAGAAGRRHVGEILRGHWLSRRKSLQALCSRRQIPTQLEGISLQAVLCLCRPGGI